VIRESILCTYLDYSFTNLKYIPAETILYAKLTSQIIILIEVGHDFWIQ